MAVASPEFLELDFDNLIDYISWKETEPSSALEAAAQWIMHDAEQRKHKFPDILKTIDIKQCSASALKNVITKYGSQLTIGLDTAQEFIKAAFSDPPELHDQGTGYDIIVLGGMDPDDAFNRQSWMLNLQSGDTVEKACLPSGIKGLFFPAMYNTSKGALFAGASENEGRQDEVSEDPKTQCIIYQKTDNTWTILPELPTVATRPAAVCMDVKIYVIGGADNQKMDCLDMKSMTWESCPDLLQGLFFPIVGCVGGCIYVVFSTCLSNEQLCTSRGISVQCFDTKTSCWSFKANIPAAVTETLGTATVTVDDRMFVLGGKDKICLSYDTRKDAWTILTPPCQRHHWGSAVYLKGQVILSGGDNEENVPSDTIERYNSTKDVWEILPVKLPKSLKDHCMILA